MPGQEPMLHSMQIAIITGLLLPYAYLFKLGGSFSNPSKRISRQEPSRLRIVVPALQVIQPRHLIIPVPRIAVGILNSSCFLQEVPVSIVLIRTLPQLQLESVRCYHISPIVGLVVVGLATPGHADRLDCLHRCSWR